MSRKYLLLVGLAALGAVIFAGCKHSAEIKHTADIKPIKIEPIHITLDINVKVQKELDNFFGDIDAASDTMQTGEE